MGEPLSAARRVAWQVLGDIRRREGRAREVLRTSERMSGLSVRDIALVEHLVLGVIQTQGVLDTQLKHYVSRPSSLEPRVRDALRLSCYELMWMDTPEPVAVSQGVELVRLASQRAARLANAVLHKVAAQSKPACIQAQHTLTEACASNNFSQLDVMTMSLATGLPTWLIKQVQLAQGNAAAAHWAQAQLAPAPLWISADPSHFTASQLEHRLAQASLPFEPTTLPETFKLTRAAGLSRAGTVGHDLIASDFAARLVALIATPHSGEHLLEIGQGRATKTLLMQAYAQQQGGPFWHVGVDSVAYKTKVAAQRLASSLAPWCSSLTFDALELAGTNPSRPLPPELDSQFDTVFLDAPCSGTGTLRRHPEICWSLAPEDVAPKGVLPQLQLALLAAAAARVKPRGHLIYSTCSVLASENTQVIDAFLNSQAGRAFRLSSPLESPAVKASTPEVQALIASFTSADKSQNEKHKDALNQDDKNKEVDSIYFQSIPRLGGPDGHFCACLVRVNQQ